MNVKDIAHDLFEVDHGYWVFDNAEEREILDPNFDEDELLLAMPDMQLDMQFGDSVWAVASDELPLDMAHLIARKGDKEFGVYILDDPADPDTIPEDFATTIPVGVGWEYESQDNDDLYSLTTLIEARVSAPEEADVEDAEVVEEVPVSDSDVAGDAGADEAVEVDGDDEVPTLIDAELLGEDHPDMQELLQKPFVFMTGDMYGQKDRRNTQDGDWQRVEMSLLQWLIGGEKSAKGPWGLARHPVSKSKEGASVVLAEAIGGSRKDAAIETMYAIGLDIDSGAALDDVIAKIEDLGLFAIVYTSFSHGKDSLDLKHDDIVRKLRLDDTPNRVQIQQYLRQHHKDRYDESFINEIEIVDARKQTADGLRVILKTPPLDKFRVVIPLMEPVKLADLAPTVSQWKDVWADAVCGVAVNMLDVTFDATCADVNRLFFTPRHPKDSDDWYAAVIQGRPLRFEEIEPHSRNAYVKSRGESTDPFAQGTVGNDGSEQDRETFLSPKGVHMNQWHTKHKDRFLIANALEDYAPDKIRVAGGEKSGTVHLECPFEHEHSTEGGTATMAMNPDENEAGYWTVFCRHDACQGRHKLEFLRQMFEDEWLPETVMKSEEYNLEGEDEEVEEEEPVEEGGPLAEARALPDNLSEEDIRKFIKRHTRMGADDVMKASLTDILKEKTPLTKQQIKGYWKDAGREQRERQREEALAEGGGESTTPVVNEWDFGDMVQWSTDRIKDANAKTPRLFHYIDDIARIEETADALPRIRMLSEPQFSAELNEITKWNHVTQMGEMTRVREVAAPRDVVSQLYSSRHLIYPKLRGLVTSPTFTKDGTLITTPGFHHQSGLFYHPDLTVDIPKVDLEPSAEDVYEAKRLLIEEVFADFPLGGLNRVEIMEQGLNGEGVPAVTNLIGMMVLMFCRDMVDGPTPGHLLTKPAPGTGASLLTDVCSIIANGEVTPAQSLPTNKEEMAKTLLTIIADGSNIIYFDNIDQAVDNGDLASALTAPKYKGRVLGKTQTVEAEVRAVWVLCGNNVRLSGELLRRLTMVDLNARMTNPETRSGWRHADVRGWVKENRGRLVWACLTLVQNWIAKGKPLDNDHTLNSYENWSRVVGGIMHAAGLGGFLENRQELRERATDNSDDDITIFLDTWWEDFIDQPVLMRSPDSDEPSLIRMAVSHDLQLPIRTKKNMDDEVTYDPRLFGRFLSTYEGRVIRLSDDTEVEVEKLNKRTKHGFYWKLTPIKQVKGNVEA